MNDIPASYDVTAIRAELLAKMGESAGDYPAQIERRFPRILARLASLWGTAALDEYLDALMLTDREGRQGFPPEVAIELFRLTNVHAALGLAPKRTGHGWAIVDDSMLDRKALLKKE